MKRRFIGFAEEYDLICTLKKTSSMKKNSLTIILNGSREMETTVLLTETEIQKIYSLIRKEKNGEGEMKVSFDLAPPSDKETKS
jgi:hypothetical protein